MWQLLGGTETWGLPNGPSMKSGGCKGSSRKLWAFPHVTRLGPMSARVVKVQPCAGAKDSDISKTLMPLPSRGNQGPGWDWYTGRLFQLSVMWIHTYHIYVLLKIWSKYAAVSSVQLLSCVWLFVTPWTAACQASLSITNSCIYSNSCPLSQWCHPTISLSVITFSTCLQSFPATVSFPMSQFFTSGSQRLRASASASVSPMNIQDQFPLGLTGCISLQSKGLSRVFSNTTVQKHQFFSAQLLLRSNSHIHT